MNRAASSTATSHYHTSRISHQELEHETTLPSKCMTTFHLAQLVINALELVVGDWGLIFGIFVTNVSLFYQCILMGKCGSLGGSGGSMFVFAE